jgi:chromosome segregation ATPase
LSEEKNVLESQIVDLGADKENLHQQLISLEDSRKEEQAAHDILVAELETLQANSRQLGEVYQQQMVVKSEEIASMEKKLETAVQKEVELEVRIAEVNNEKNLLVRENELLKEEVSELISTIAKEKNVLETNLNVLKGELESNVNAMEQSQQKIQHMELELSGLIANKSSLESEVQKLSAECTVLAEGRLHLEKENNRMDEFYKEQVKEYENRLSRLTEEHSMHVTSMEERLEAAQQINLRIEEVNGEKIRLLQENKLLQEEVSNLTSCITKEKIVFETDFNALKEELESNIKVMEESKQKIQEMELELTEMIAQKSSLESEVEELSAKCSEMAEKRSRLEEENRKMDVSHKEQLAEFERRLSSLTEDHAVRINQLDERLNAVVQLNHQLKDDCTRLESEREAINAEKSGFEQMYLEVKAACEEAETKIQMEGELARQEVDAKKQQVLQQSNALDELEHMISSLRQDKADAESSYTQQLLLLQAEKQEMMESHDRVEQHNASLLASFEASRNELERQLTDANLKLKDHVELLQQSHLSRQQTEEQMEALEVKVCKLELDLKKAVEEKGQLTNEMMVLQAVQGEMRNLEVAMEQLTSEIQELSFKKANLEKLREVLEEAKATAEEETRQLRREVESKELEISHHVEKVEFTESQLQRSKNDQILLQARILGLESTVSNLATNATESSQTIVTLEKQLQEREAALERATVELNAEKEQSVTTQAAFIKAISDLQSSSENNRRELEAAITSLKKELSFEKQRASEESNSIEALTLEKKEANELAESLQVKLSEMEAEVLKLAESGASMKTEKLQLEKTIGSRKIELENEKIDMEKQMAQLTFQLESISSSFSDMESECSILKSDKLQTLQEKAQLEQKFCDIEKNFQSTVEELQSQLKTTDAELQSQIAKVNEFSSSTHALKLQIETIVQEKETLEKDFGARISTLNSDKEMLLTKNASVERENQELKSELAAEKTKILQGKGEIMLEHRKEKAALEARLLVAQSQMKSMQEKLVNMTVANNSHAPLEHKVSVLTSELEAVNKAKSELEKRLDDSISVRKEEMLSVKKEEVGIHLIYVFI